MRDIINEIWGTAKRNKLRTSLTGFAVAWGIFMLIFLLGSGNGLTNAQQMQMDRYLSHSAMVGGGVTAKPCNGLKEGRRIVLDQHDIDKTSSAFSHVVDDAGGEISAGTATVSLGDCYFSTELKGVYPNKCTIDKRKMLYGRFINPNDLKERRKVLVISNDNAKELSSRNMAGLVGRRVEVAGMAFLIVGIYEADKSGMSQPQSFAPFTTIQKIYNKGDKTDLILFSTKNMETEEANEAFETNYRAVVNTHHQAAPDDESAIWIWNRFTQSLQMAKGMNIIHTALWIIGLFTLLSGIVGVSNIMLITVKERTHEFGIRKAIGATPWSIMKLIITESVVITTFFGYVGMLLGIAANEYMNATIGQMKVNSGTFEATMFSNPTVGLDVCIAVTMVIVVAGTLAGLLPARKAALIKPIDALSARG